MGNSVPKNHFRCPVDQAVCGPEFVAETAWSNVFFESTKKYLTSVINRAYKLAV